jgi:soluble lytic murein transglycosylase
MTRRIPAALLVSLACTAQNLPQSQVELMARSLRNQSTPENRAPLITYAAQHRSDQAGALALVALGAHAKGEDGSPYLENALSRLPRIRDYVLYLTAREQFEARAYSAAAKSAQQAVAAFPESPIASRALVLAARATWKAGDAAGALKLLDTNRPRLLQPAAELLQAQIEEEAGATDRALQRYRRIWIDTPRSGEADDAEKALARLGAAGASLNDRLKRGLALVEGNDHARGAKELSALLPELNGRDRELARVKLGLAYVQTRSYTAAYNQLQPPVGDPGLDAERLHHLMNAARRLTKYAETMAIADEFRQKYPTSVWRLQALIAAGDQFYQQNDASRADTVFQSCATGFTQVNAAYCHWRTTFASHLRRQPETRAELQEHLKRFPHGQHASAALYFLGRLAEESRDATSAKAYYQRASRIFPNHFYALLARDRLREDALATAPASSMVLSFLDNIAWPSPPVKPSFELTPGNRSRQERANLLAQAALDEFTDLELRSGVSEQPHVTAMLLAELAQRRGEPEKGIRAIKQLYPAYFSLPLEDAPFQFWQLAYPMPWRPQLETLAKEYTLDPFMVAGLIRQESEFDAEAISRSNARGLTQVMPTTGLDLSRRIGLKGYHTGQLFSPEVNLKLGTFYMRWLLDRTERPEFMLASYNAGKSRVDNWKEVYQYREPAEFVESIPLGETRNYVQIVLRNADFYRRLYASRPDTFTPTPAVRAVPPMAAAPPPKVAAKKPVAKKSKGTAAKRKPRE